MIVTVDSLRADRVGFGGRSSGASPNMDTLAARGTVYTQALAPVPDATPAVASLHTGVYPPTHGLRTAPEDALPPGAVTLAEILKAQGYKTGAVAGSLMLHAKYGLDQGFDVYAASFAEVPRPSQIAETGILAEKVADRALEFFETARGAPFFLWVNFQDPHYFYFPPESYASQFASDLYDGEIAYVDHELGRILTKLRDYGLEESALVVLAGSNGEGLGDHGEAYHGTTLQGSTTRVPLVVAGAGFAPGARVDSAVSLVDIVPTVLDRLGLPAPPGLEGRSLAGALDPDRPIYLETLLPARTFGWEPMFGVVSGRWKYVESVRGELFDLAADPAELSDVSSSHREQRDRLAALARAYAARAPYERPLTEALSGKVRALGYPTQAPPREPVDPRDRVDVANDTQKADRSARRRQLEAASFLFEGVLKKDPGNYIALIDTALLELPKRRNDEALRLLTKAQALYPEAAEPYHQISHLIDSDDETARQRARALLSIAAEIDPLNEEVLYDMACSHAVTGQTGAALDSLERAIKAGFRDFQWMAVDTDLDSLRSDPRFDLLTEGKAKPPKTSPAASGGR